MIPDKNPITATEITTAIPGPLPNTALMIFAASLVVSSSINNHGELSSTSKNKKRGAKPDRAFPEIS
jgi:hypothetical protein